MARLTCRQEVQQVVVNVGRFSFQPSSGGGESLTVSDLRTYDHHFAVVRNFSSAQGTGLGPGFARH
jgi:hypothetical protein